MPRIGISWVTDGPVVGWKMECSTRQPKTRHQLHRGGSCCNRQCEMLIKLEARNSKLTDVISPSTDVQHSANFFTYSARARAMLYSRSSAACGSPFLSLNFTVRPDFTANTLSSSRYLESSSKIWVVRGLNPSAWICLA